jgi:hypothetical protein
MFADHMLRNGAIDGTALSARSFPPLEENAKPKVVLTCVFQYIYFDGFRTSKAAAELLLLAFRFKGLVALLADANLLVALEFMAYSSRSAVRANHHHVRNVNSSFLFGDSTLDVPLWVGADVLLDHAHMLNQNTVFAGDHAEYAALLAAVAAGDNLDLIVTLNVQTWHFFYSLPVPCAAWTTY